MRTSAVGAVLCGVLLGLPLTARAQEAATPAPAAAVAPTPAEEPKGDLDPGKYVAEFLEKVGVPIRLNGYAWVDTGYLSRTYEITYPQQDAAYLQGRVVLGADLKRTFGDYYGEVKVQFLGLVNEYAKSQYEPHTLEAYLQIGHQRWWDFQIGRFLAWEVYHRGLGIDLYSAEEAGISANVGAPQLYWLQLTRGYVNEAGQAALHFYPFSFLKFELAGVYGQENSQNNYGVRPVVAFNLGGLEIIGGYELLARVPQISTFKNQSFQQGVAGKVQYAFPVVTVGADAAWTTASTIDINGDQDSIKSYDQASFGGFVDIDFWRNTIGFGYHRSNQTDFRGNFQWHDQAFAAYQLRLPIKGLAVKAVYGLAHATLQDVTQHVAPWNAWMHSVRVRISYDFE